MNFLNRSLVSVVLSALFIAASPVAHAEPVARFCPDYTVFLDPPTGFVFVKLPAGWKFVGKVQAKDMARLPPGVVTALLTETVDQGEPSQLASRTGE